MLKTISTHKTIFKNTNISNSNIQTIINKIKIVPGAGGGVAGGALRAPARVLEPRGGRAGGGAGGAGGGVGGASGRRCWGTGARGLKGWTLPLVETAVGGTYRRIIRRYPAVGSTYRRFNRR